MKIPVKRQKEIQAMAQSGQKLACVLESVLREIKPGVKLNQLEKLASQLIEKEGGQPSFKMVPGYRWASCLNLNDGVVHGVPNRPQIQPGDLVSLDLGFFYRGFHADMARTVLIPDPQTENQEKKAFLEAGQKALQAVIKVAKAGNRIGHLSQAIEKEIKKHGYYPVTSLTGHGIGRQLHQPPSIPCFLKGKLQTTPLLRSGMTLAIEVIYTQKKTELEILPDGWTVKTKDGSWGGLFEDTILITPSQARILTRCSKPSRA